MKRLKEILNENEDWLIHRVLDYAKRRDYTKYTSTLEEAWRVSIQGVSQALTAAADRYTAPPELGPDEVFVQDPVASFGILEAARHRDRGVSLDMFLGLFKYYCQSYLDLMEERIPDSEIKKTFRLFIRRCFDRMEIGFCTKWSDQREHSLLEQMRDENRRLVNEKNKYLTIFESLSNPVFLLDMNNQVVNMNFSAEAIFGRAGKPGAAYYGRPQAGSVLSWINEEIAAFGSGGQWEMTFDKEYAGSTGTFNFLVKMTKMLDVSEKFQGTVIVLEDITEQKQFEQALKDERDFAVSLVLNCTIPTFLIDKNHQLMVWNKACEELTGLKADTVLGSNTFWRGFHVSKPHGLADYVIDGLPAGVENFYDLITPSNLAPNGLRAEGWFKNAQGKKHYLAFHAAPVYDSQGQLAAALETVQDLTFRKEAEEILYENEQTFRATFAQAAAGIASYSLAGEFMMCNPKMREIIGYEMDELVTMKVQDIIHPEDLPLTQSKIRPLVAGKFQSFEREQRLIRKNRKVIWVQEYVSLIRDLEKQPKYLLAVVDDITERRMMEEKMKERDRKLRAELELAAAVQASFLPRALPSVPGIEFAWEYSPSEFVAGDMLNIFRLDDQTIGFYVMDVMGHGVSAALKALILSFILKPELTTQGAMSKPSAALMMLNNRFVGEIPDGRFLTIIYGVLDLGSKELCYCSAGHCPPILVRTDGEVVELTHHNPAVGLAEGITYEDRVIQLEPGVKLVLYTDGITDTKNEKGRSYSRARLKFFAGKNHALGIAGLVKGILEDARGFAGHAQQNDDLTVLGCEILRV